MGEWRGIYKQVWRGIYKQVNNSSERVLAYQMRPWKAWVDDVVVWLNRPRVMGWVQGPSLGAFVPTLETLMLVFCQHNGVGWAPLR